MGSCAVTDLLRVIKTEAQRCQVSAQCNPAKHQAKLLLSSSLRKSCWEESICCSSPQTHFSLLHCQKTSWFPGSWRPLGNASSVTASDVSLWELSHLVPCSVLSPIIYILFSTHMNFKHEPCHAAVPRPPSSIEAQFLELLGNA